MVRVSLSNAEAQFARYLNEYLPHAVHINDFPVMHIQEWCRDQFGPPSTFWRVISHMELDCERLDDARWDFFTPHEWSTRFHFRDPNDAMLFKLRWC